VNLNLKPGELLNINNISEKLGVSRTPVREALIKLQKEGLVDIVPQVGSKVSKIDLNRVKEEQFIRSSLEEKALTFYLKNPEIKALDELKANLEAQKLELEKNNILAFLELDDEFHKIIFYSTDKKLSWEIIQNISVHYRRIRIMSLWHREILEDVFVQHEAIYTSISEKNLQKAFKHLRDHFSRINGIEAILLQEYPDYFQKEQDNKLNALDYFVL
jgi:DNA-binding GntR family transcriptional regulator